MLCTEPDYPIKGFIETSFLDWKEHLSSVIFLGGCNFRCPFCHNRDLVLDHLSMDDIPVDFVIATLRKYKKWVDCVVVTGGEPTINLNLFRLLGEFKSEKMRIKLDTNGSNPAMVKGLVNDGLVDYIAMDVKGPVDRYSRWCGTHVDTRKIDESIGFILEGKVDYEFRMTVVPFLHREEDVYEVASHIRSARKFFIQEFRPECTLDPAFGGIEPFSADKIQRIRSNVSDIMSVQQQDQVRETPKQKYNLIKNESDLRREE